jgi:hypothetical protein
MRFDSQNTEHASIILEILEENNYHYDKVISARDEGEHIVVTTTYEGEFNICYIEYKLFTQKLRQKRIDDCIYEI